MTPLINPEYQHILSYLSVRINFLLSILYIRGRIKTITARIKGILNNIKAATKMASKSPSMLRIDAPR